MASIGAATPLPPTRPRHIAIAQLCGAGRHREDPVSAGRVTLDSQLMRAAMYIGSHDEVARQAPVFGEPGQHRGPVSRPLVPQGELASGGCALDSGAT